MPVIRTLNHINKRNMLVKLYKNADKSLTSINENKFKKKPVLIKTDEKKGNECSIIPYYRKTDVLFPIDCY